MQAELCDPKQVVDLQGIAKVLRTELTDVFLRKENIKTNFEGSKNQAFIPFLSVVQFLLRNVFILSPAREGCFDRQEISHRSDLPIDVVVELHERRVKPFPLES